MLSGLDNPLHLLIVLVVVMLLFGAKRLPELGSGLGNGIKSFKDGLAGQTHGDTVDSLTAETDSQARR